jgi:hypothetical protein
MADTKRRKTVAVRFDDAGNALLSLYTAPDAVTGEQGVAEVITLTPAAVHDGLVDAFTLRGVINTFSNIYNRIDNPGASDLRREWDKFIATVTDGTWTPGRTMGDAEPDDIVVALAEVSGQPVHVVQAKIDEMLEQPKVENGSPKRDAKGRIVHVWSKAKLYTALENSDPRVKIALSKILADRAKAMAADARTAKPDAASPFAGLFTPAAAAN